MGHSGDRGGWVEGGWSNVVSIAVESSLDDATKIRDIKVGPFFLIVGT